MTALNYPNLFAPALPALCPRCGKLRLRKRLRRWWDRLRDPFGLIHPANGDTLIGNGGVLLDASGKRVLDDTVGNACCCPETSSSGCFTELCDQCDGGIFATSARVTFSGVISDGACHAVPHNSCATPLCWGVGGTDYWFKNTSWSGAGSYCLPKDVSCGFTTELTTIGTTAMWTTASGGCNGAPFNSTGLGVSVSRWDASHWIVAISGSIGGGPNVYVFVGLSAAITDCTKSFSVRNVAPGMGVPFSGFPIANCTNVVGLGCCLSMGRAGSALVEMCC